MYFIYLGRDGRLDLEHALTKDGVHRQKGGSMRVVIVAIVPVLILSGCKFSGSHTGGRHRPSEAALVRALAPFEQSAEVVEPFPTVSVSMVRIDASILVQLLNSAPASDCDIRGRRTLNGERLLSEYQGQPLEFIVTHYEPADIVTIRKVGRARTAVLSLSRYEEFTARMLP